MGKTVGQVKNYLLCNYIFTMCPLRATVTKNSQ